MSPRRIRWSYCPDIPEETLAPSGGWWGYREQLTSVQEYEPGFPVLLEDWDTIDEEWEWFSSQSEMEKHAAAHPDPATI